MNFIERLPPLTLAIIIHASSVLTLITMPTILVILFVGSFFFGVATITFLAIGFYFSVKLLQQYFIWNRERTLARLHDAEQLTEEEIKAAIKALNFLTVAGKL